MYQNELIGSINELPKGYISKKTINGKEYNYLQWKENGKVKSKYIKAFELDLFIAAISERKELEVELELLNKANSINQINRINQYINNLMLSSEHFSIGSQDYEEIISNKSFYVDKTDFIRQWWQSNDKVTLITRPRRFGKTLNLSMVNCFFSVLYKNRTDLFTDMVINKSGFMNLQGSYPVIFISFGAVKGATSHALMTQIQTAILSSLFPYIDSLKSVCENPSDLDNFMNMYRTATFEDILSLLSLCFSLMYKTYGKKIIILLDEYDTPMIEAWTLGVWDECADNIRSLFNTLFKTNPYLERGLLTGITRISKEAFFSDLNNLRVYGMTSNNYSECFGFTKEEVSTALESQSLNTLSEVSSWYDGFTIGNTTNIYNPWSIVNYLADKQFQPYWVNTSSNKLISDLFMSGTPDLKYAVEDLLNDKPIFSTIDETMIFEDLYSQDYAIWSLLFNSGYLKPISINGETFELVPTNKEVKILLTKLVRRWFEGMYSYNMFIKALMVNDLDYMNIYMNSITQAVFSYYDTSSGNKEPERFYHGFVLGLIVNQQNDYIITSNRESGLGRYDIIMNPRNKNLHNGIIIEFKVKSSSETSLKVTAQKALKQIEEKAYATELISYGIDPNRIYKYAFAFDGKKVLIMS